MTRKLVGTEWRLLRREPIALFWAVAFPVILLIVMGLASSGPDKDLGGVSLVATYVPILLAFELAILAINALPTVVASYREKGILRRLATTPVAPSRVLIAQIAVHLAVVVAAAVLVLAIARAAFGVALPEQAFGFAVAYALTAAALFGVGLLVAAAAPTSRTANAIGAIVFFPMMFFAGLWVPRAAMGATLRDVSDATPLGAGVGALQRAMQGDFPRPMHLAALAVWALVASVAARTLFRWD
jgi:ABC-2 type transport system permease protein